jgi:hypothetical protein
VDLCPDLGDPDRDAECGGSLSCPEISSIESEVKTIEPVVSAAACDDVRAVAEAMSCGGGEAKGPTPRAAACPFTKPAEYSLK